MIKILNSSLTRLGVIKNVISSDRMEEINGENILDFTTVLDSTVQTYIDTNTVFELDGDYFDIAYFKKDANDDDTFTIDVESEHISYRLNRPEYNKEYFTEIGAPSVILGKILQGTGFSVGTVEFTTTVTYSAQEAKSRRQLLMEFAAYIGAEVKFDKFVISLVQHLGSTSVKPVIKGKNVNVVSKIVNKREKDKAGNTLVSYSCAPVYLPGDSYTLGDDVLLIQNDLGIREQLRVVKITRDPYMTKNAKFEFSNYIDGLADYLYRMQTDSVVKNKLYNGARIGPEYGFESVRNDLKARAYFRSDGMVFQSGDGAGNWTDRLYYEYDSETDETILVFDGVLTTQAIKVISQSIDETFDLSDLGELAYEDAVEKAKLGTTIIERGYLKTGFVDASRIDTGTLNANQVNIEASDANNNVIIKLGEISPAIDETPARFGLQITGNNGELMLDEYGLDPRFVKAFKNLIWNSTFERYDPITKIPQFWSGGESYAGSSFDNTRSLKLDVGEMSEQTITSGDYSPRPDPSWWGNQKTRLSFFKKGGDVQVQIFSEWDFSPYELTGENGTKAYYYNTGASDNWDDGRYTLSFVPVKSGRIWIRFANIGASSAYIDAVQMEPDFNGKYPSFYTNGPYSISADEVPMSDTWLEYINVPYASSIDIRFNHAYGLPPTVNASLLRNINATNVGTSFGPHNITPNIDLIIENVDGLLQYTGAHITWGGSPPASIADGFVSIHVIGRL